MICQTLTLIINTVHIFQSRALGTATKPTEFSAIWQRAIVYLFYLNLGFNGRDMRAETSDMMH